MRNDRYEKKYETDKKRNEGIRDEDGNEEDVKGSRMKG